MREALSRLLLLLCCCVLCAALRSVAGAVRSERERHWTALVGRETTRRPALREREATESVLLSRISMWRSTFSRCRRQEFFTLSFASGASFANQKKLLLLLLHSTLRPSFQQEAPLFLPFRLRSPRAPARPRARVLCSCVSEQETLSLLTEQESAQTFDAFLLPPPLFFSSFASLDLKKCYDGLRRDRDRGHGVERGAPGLYLCVPVRRRVPDHQGERKEELEEGEKRVAVARFSRQAAAEASCGQHEELELALKHSTTTAGDPATPIQGLDLSLQSRWCRVEGR